MKRLIHIQFLPRVLLARSTMRCICVLATVAMVTAPVAAATPAVHRPVTSLQIRRNSRRPVTHLQEQRPDVKSAAAVATQMVVRRRMRLPLGLAPWGLRHGQGGCARQLRRRRLEATRVLRTVELPAASSRTNTRTFGRCRCPYLANNVHFPTLITR